MIEYIGLEMFKSIHYTELSPSKITLLIGPNGTGKSSVLQSLLLLRQSKDSGQVVVSGQEFQLGAFSDIISKNASEATIFVGGYVEKDIFGKDLVCQIPWKSIKYGYRIKLNEAGAQEIIYDVSFGGAFSNTYSLSSEWSPLMSNIKNTVNIEDDSYEYSSQKHIGLPITLLNKGDENQRRVYQSLREIVSAFYHQLQNLHYVPASRGFTRPNYKIDSDSIDFFSSYSLDVQNRQVSTTFGILRDLEDKISEYMLQVTGVKVRPNLYPKQTYGIRVIRNNLESISIVNEGFGTNQLVQLFLTISMAKNGSTILIEEPEIHLHPKAQSALSELLVNIAIKDNKQLIITTHSEHIMYKLLSIIKSGALKPSDVSIYHFNIENGKSNIEKLIINKKGQVKGGLKSFFDVEIEQLKNLIE